YYEYLWLFNQRQALQRKQRQVDPPPPNRETHQQATQRLLFARPTLNKDAPVVFSAPAPEPPTLRIDPASLRPGVTPLRLAGRPPKCFFALAKAFLGTAISGQPPEPEFVHKKLRENPAFARTCGFTIPRPSKPERHTDIASLRKIQHFDQIMTQAGLWEQLAQQSVQENLQKQIIKPEVTIVHDTTHYLAYSSMVVLQLPEAKASERSRGCSTHRPPDGQQPVSSHNGNLQASPCSDPSTCTSAIADSPPNGQEDQKTPGKSGKTPNNKNTPRRRKSHPRTTKPCRCPDRHHCPHPWINADDGAGTVVKSSGRMYWAHKASTLGFPGQEVLLDAVAMSDAATHDSQS
ncbi:MAG TPA: hypothetical protein G4O05_02730, partial [Caldilineae bacterium]|nr:hypothetical protein [Caldilineae bacterium]